ncbi:MAG TPA: hypothetical protein VNB68_02500, partial [Nitrososphaeraceae archaeon]|nr:hypothetical protein [Nitrososphaeraceae archaeon]
WFSSSIFYWKLGCSIYYIKNIVIGVSSMSINESMWAISAEIQILKVFFWNYLRPPSDYIENIIQYFFFQPFCVRCHIAQ